VKYNYRNVKNNANLAIMFFQCGKRGKAENRGNFLKNIFPRFPHFRNFRIEKMRHSMGYL